MVHVLPLPGAPRRLGSLDAAVERATADARALAGAGFDAVLVENFGDAPFFGAHVPPVTVASMTRVARAVVDAVPVPVGVNVLRNDAAAALAVAVAAGAGFIRVNVHVGRMITDQGALEGRAADTLRTRAALEPEIRILADVMVKHAVPPPGLDLADAARDAWARGLPDGLVVSGSGTGHPTDRGALEVVRAAVPDAPLFVGSGATAGDARALLEVADGLIVGSAVSVDGRAGAGVDAARAGAFVRAAREA